jgi:hypothetical protein
MQCVSGTGECQSKSIKMPGQKENGRREMSVER